MRTTNLLPILALFLAWNGLVFADEAVLNNAPSSVNKFKAVVNTLSPGFDTLYNVRDGDWEEGVSASLWNFTSDEYLLASLRAGYGQQELVYTSLRADLPGISKRFVPATVQGIATKGYLDVLWNAVGKYGSVGPFVGYAFDDDAVAWGVTLGGQVSF